jgi:pilus assembly protein CpaE
MSATRETEDGKRLLWASAGTTDRKLLDTAARAFELQLHICAPGELARLLRPAGDFVGIELSGDPTSGLAAIKELHARAPGASIIAASANDDVEMMRSAMQAGACDVLTLPLASHELHKTLLRLTQVATRAPAAGVDGQIITVYGVRGGLGTTTIAVNLAFKLKSVTGAETALVDLDVQRGDAAAFVNLVPVHSLATLATAPGEVDEVFLASAITRHPSGVSVLGAPPTIEEAELVTEREVEIALPLLQSRFAYTVIDTPRAITTSVVAAWEHSNRVFILTDLSVPSVRAARRVFELLTRLDRAVDNAELLVTEIVPGPIDLKKAIQVIGKEPFAIIPRDDSAGSAMNDGVPLNGRPTRLALALDALACRIANIDPAAKSTRGLLGRIFPKGARP